MKIHQIACQLFTLRDQMKTAADIAAGLIKLRTIGYQAVQVSGIGPIPEADLVQLAKDNGITLCATHEPGDRILNEPQKVADRLRALNCKITAYPYPSGINFDTLESTKEFCRRLNTAGQVLHEAGQVLCYHNHQIEFRRLAGKPLLEIIYAETDPQFVQGEPDTYWIQNGGGDPVEWCHRLKGRLPILHLKDYTVLTTNAVSYTEIGNGNLNWKRIIPAAEAAGCQWFAVEQDKCPGDPFESVRQSFNYIRDNLCSP